MDSCKSPVYRLKKARPHPINPVTRPSQLSSSSTREINEWNADPTPKPLNVNCFINDWHVTKEIGLWLLSSQITIVTVVDRKRQQECQRKKCWAEERHSFKIAIVAFINVTNQPTSTTPRFVHNREILCMFLGLRKLSITSAPPLETL